MSLTDQVLRFAGHAPKITVTPAAEAPTPHADSWQNPYTGLGTCGRDKVTAGMFMDPGFLQWTELVGLYHGNSLAAKLVEFRPLEAFRKGYAVVVPDDNGETNSELATSLEQAGEALELNKQFLEAWIWGRLFGGCLLIVGADDGKDPSQPLDEKNIRSIKYLNVVDRRFAYASQFYANPLEPKYGRPSVYQITNALDGPAKGAVMQIHETRVIRFDGARTDVIKRRMLAGWTLSVLQRPYDILRTFDTSFQAIANLMTDVSQGVFKIKNLMEMIAADSGDLDTRMQLVDMQRSAGRSILVDADGEDFERTATPLAGVPDVLDRIMNLVSMSGDIPVSVLFGRSAAGMNATGDSDFRALYDSIASDQTNYVKPLMLRLYTLICLAKDGPTGGEVPEELDLKFHSLWELTAKEQADLEYQVAQKDALYITNGVLQPEEVALSRYRTGTFSAETEIDVDAREKSLAAELDFSVQQSEAKAAAGPTVGVDPKGEPENPGLTAPGPGSPGGGGAEPEAV